MPPERVKASDLFTAQPGRHPIVGQTAAWSRELAGARVSDPILRHRTIMTNRQRDPTRGFGWKMNAGGKVHANSEALA